MELKKFTVVGFDSRPVAAELLCSKSMAKAPHYGHISRLKQNFDSTDPTEKRTWRIAVRTLTMKRQWHVPNGVITCKKFQKKKIGQRWVLERGILKKYTTFLLIQKWNVYFFCFIICFLFYCFCMRWWSLEMPNDSLEPLLHAQCASPPESRLLEFNQKPPTLLMSY